MSQAPSRDGLALRSPRGHLLFGRKHSIARDASAGMQGKWWVQKTCKGVQGTLRTAFRKGRVNVWLGVKSLRLCH
jgi:hypothetical protein